MRATALARRHEAGFTLTEALVALFVFGLLSSMILSVLTLQGRAESTLRNRIDADDRVALAQNLLRDRMDAMRAVVDIHGAGDSLTFRGLPGSMDFESPTYQAEGPHALHHFRLQKERDGNLVLYALNTRSVVDWRTQGTTGWQALPLLERVDRVEFTYFGPDRFTGRDAWQETWERRRSLPKLVRVRLAFATGDPRAWPVLMVKPAPQTRLPCRDDYQTKDCGDPA